MGVLSAASPCFSKGVKSIIDMDKFQNKRVTFEQLKKIIAFVLDK